MRFGWNRGVAARRRALVFTVTLTMTLAAAPVGAVHWEGSGDDNDWSNSENWSSGSVPTSGKVDFDAMFGPATPVVDVDRSVDLTSLNFSDWEVAVGIIQDMNAQFYGAAGHTFETFIMNFEPSGSPFDEGRVSAAFYAMDMRVDNFDFDRGFVGELLDRGRIAMTLGQGTKMTVVNAGQGRIDGLFGTIPDGNVVANKMLLTIRDNAVLDNVRLGGAAPPQYPLVLGPGSELRLSGGGELGWWTANEFDAPLVVGVGGGRITADYTHTGLVVLQASNLTFGGPDPYFPPAPDPLTNVDKDPNAGEELWAFLTGKVTGPGGIQINHPLYNVRLSSSLNDFTGDIRIYSGTLRAAAGKSLGALGKEIEFLNGVYKPDEGFTTALAMRFHQGGTGTIDTTDGNHTVSRSWYGAGNFRKAGDNTLTLNRSGAEFNGDYEVAGGTLRLPRADAVHAGNDVAVLAGGTLDVERDVRFGGLSGGGVVQIDSGYSVTVNGAEVGQPAPDFSGALTGDGDLWMDYPGHLQKLSGDNSGFGGQVKIDLGAMEVASAAAMPHDVELLSSSAALVHSYGGTYGDLWGGPVSGNSGTFQKTGANTLTLVENVLFGGDIRVAEGTLFLERHSRVESDIWVNETGLAALPAVGATLSGAEGRVRGDVHVMNGGLLTGDLIIEEDLRVYEGGEFDPEHDPNNLGVRARWNINGDFTLDPGGLLEIDVTRVQGFRDSDILFVDGAATLGGTLRVVIDPEHPLLSTEEQFFLLAAEINGEFENVAFGERIETAGGEGTFLLEKVEQASQGTFTAQLVDYQPIVPPLAGDYNNDGLVDAADYTAWRDNFGEPAGALPNDTVGGPIGTAHYDAWAANFGASSAAPGPTTAPEPYAVAVVVAALTLLPPRRRAPLGRSTSPR